MDPNTALMEIRELTEKIRSGQRVDLETYAEWGDELAQKVFDLDEWLSRGGVPPAAWV